MSYRLIFLLAYDLCLVWGKHDELCDWKLFCFDIGYSSFLVNLYRSFNTVERYCILRSKMSPMVHWSYTQSRFDFSVDRQGFRLRFGIASKLDVDVPRLYHHLFFGKVEALLFFRPFLTVHNKIIDFDWFLLALLLKLQWSWTNKCTNGLSPWKSCLTMVIYQVIQEKKLIGTGLRRLRILQSNFKTAQC